MSIWRYANPTLFMGWSRPVTIGAALLAAVLMAIGLGWGFFYTPDDFRQGSTVKIIYLHVPTALMAINGWFMMVAASLIWLIRRHWVSVLAAKAAAPVGMVMTLAGLLTGAIWGQPTWGTYWAWDPRLTAFLILFFFYLGYLALWSAIEDGEVAADLTSYLCLVGSLFAILSRYAVFYWSNGLHQGASLSLDAAENISDVFWIPLVIAMAGFVCLFVALVLAGTRTEIRLRRMEALVRREALRA